MKNLSRNIKIVIVTGFPFAVFQGVFHSHQYGFLNLIIYSLIQGMIFGFVMMFLFFLLEKYFHFSMKKHKKETHHEGKVEIEGSINDVFRICLDSIKIFDRKCSIKKEDRDSGLLILRLGANWKTWGDVITFRIEELEKNKCKIKIMSHPYLPTTIIDYGSNLNNIELINSFFKQHGETGYAEHS